jgi:hypothetical protein
MEFNEEEDGEDDGEDETDEELPLLFNLTILPNPGEYNDTLNFTVVVTDNTDVDSVYINITNLGNFSMVEGLNDEWYFEINITLSSATNVTVWAVDTSNNWNYTSGTFTMNDEIVILTIGQIMYYSFIGILTLIIIILIFKTLLNKIKKIML